MKERMLVPPCDAAWVWVSREGNGAEGRVGPGESRGQQGTYRDLLRPSLSCKNPLVSLSRSKVASACTLNRRGPRCLSGSPLVLGQAAVEKLALTWESWKTC